LRLLPLAPDGEFAANLTRCRDAALMLFEALDADDRFAPLGAPQLDVIVWAVRAASASESSSTARAVFEAAARRDLHLALVKIPRCMLDAAGPVQEWDDGHITCLRACVMKPEHHAWMPEILSRLSAAAQECCPAKKR
jgi:hypothetical protein